MKRFSFFAHDGISWILSAIVLTGYLWAQFNVYAALPTVLLTLVLMRLFYDPDRDLPSHPLGVMSPVDGVVISTELFHDPFLDRVAQRIRIQSDLFGVYHGRSPTEGKMVEYWPTLAGDKQGYSQEDTKGAWWIKTDEGDDVVLVVTAGISLGKARCEIQAGERVGQARRCGRFLPHGVIDVLIDENSYVEINPGQRVMAGVNMLATFNHDIEPAG